MKLKVIFAVERKNLTEQDEIRLLDLEGTEFISDQTFRQAVRDALSVGYGRVHCIVGTLREIIAYARNNETFEIANYVTINIEINYEN